MGNSVNKEQLSKEVLNSNLSDEAKIELFRFIFKEAAQVMPYFVPTNTYPYSTTQDPTKNCWAYC